MNPYRQATFLNSAAELHQLPDDQGFEVAFCGRSNAGKSSALNAITQNKGLARTSKTPGRTQLINIFELDESRRLVDLPGYGYAKVPLHIKQRWQQTLSNYLFERQCIRGMILIMDIRHPLKALDQSMIDWAYQSHISTHILLTKADKLKRGPAMNTLLGVKKALGNYHGDISVQLFSSTTKLGLDEAYEKLNSWLYTPNASA